MKERVSLVGQKVILVPYMKAHVPKYHEWMQDEALRRATRSNPLNLDEENQMQLSFSQDTDRESFIVLDKDMVVGDFVHGDPHIEAMVGDVRIFMNDFDNPQTAEIEIVIAEPKSRGKGLGKESVLLMMAFAIEKLGINTFGATMGESNRISLNMFKTLGFVQISRNATFREVVLEFQVTQPKHEEIVRLLGIQFCVDSKHALLSKNNVEIKIFIGLAFSYFNFKKLLSSIYPKPLSSGVRLL